MGKLYKLAIGPFMERANSLAIITIIRGIDLEVVI